MTDNTNPTISAVTTEPSNGSALLDIRQAAALTSLTIASLYQYSALRRRHGIERGPIPTRVGSALMYMRADVETWMHAREAGL
jgi:predicted DNA-binding transcriptional regulator AlpA